MCLRCSKFPPYTDKESSKGNKNRDLRVNSIAPVNKKRSVSRERKGKTSATDKLRKKETGCISEKERSRERLPCKFSKLREVVFEEKKRETKPSQ